MGLTTSSGFIKFEKTPNNKLMKLSLIKTLFHKTYIKMSKFTFIKAGKVVIINFK